MSIKPKAKTTRQVIDEGLRTENWDLKGWYKTEVPAETADFEKPMWVSIEDLLGFLHDVVNNIPTVDMGSIDFRDAQSALVDDLEQLLLTKDSPKQVSRTEVACCSSIKSSEVKP